MTDAQSSIGRRVAKVILIILATLVAAYVCIFIGLKTNFPGPLLADYTEQQLTHHLSLESDVAPFELGWTTLEIPYLNLTQPAASEEEIDISLLNLENIKVAWLFSVLNGFSSVKLHADAYHGAIDFQIGLQERKPATLHLKQIQLDNIPALTLFPYAFLKGTLSLSESIEHLEIGAKQPSLLPKGRLYGQLDDLQIKFKDLSTVLPTEFQALAQGLTLPPIKLNSVKFNILHGKVVEVKTFKLKGDLTGSVTGKVFLKGKRWQKSRVSLQVDVTPSEALVNQLGGLKMILQGFMCNGKFQFDVYGSLGSPKIKQKGCR